MLQEWRSVISNTWKHMRENEMSNVKKGMNGEHAGYLLGGNIEEFNDILEHNVKEFQKRMKLKVDGIVGVETLTAMVAQLGRQLYEESDEHKKRIDRIFQALEQDREGIQNLQLSDEISKEQFNEISKASKKLFSMNVSAIGIALLAIILAIII